MGGLGGGWGDADVLFVSLNSLDIRVSILAICRAVGASATSYLSPSLW